MENRRNVLFVIIIFLGFIGCFCGGAGYGFRQAETEYKNKLDSKQREIDSMYQKYDPSADKLNTSDESY